MTESESHKKSPKTSSDHSSDSRYTFGKIDPIGETEILELDINFHDVVRTRSPFVYADLKTVQLQRVDRAQAQYSTLKRPLMDTSLDYPTRDLSLLSRLKHQQAEHQQSLFHRSISSASGATRSLVTVETLLAPLTVPIRLLCDTIVYTLYEIYMPIIIVIVCIAFLLSAVREVQTGSTAPNHPSSDQNPLEAIYSNL